MKFASLFLVIAFLVSGCGSVWNQYPPETLKDGSSIQLTTWNRQLKRDSVRIDRTTRSGQKSYYYLKRAAADYDECKMVSQSRTGVTLRFYDDAGNTLFDKEFPYSAFVPKKD